MMKIKSSEVVYEFRDGLEGARGSDLGVFVNRRNEYLVFPLPHLSPLLAINIQMLKMQALSLFSVLIQASGYSGLLTVRNRAWL